MTSTDDPVTDGLLTAGRFSAMTLLSAKALRIYGERNLLPPYRIDPHNGYRYYSSDQVRTGWLIALLRSADLSLEEIAAVVHADRPTAVQRLEQVLAARERQLEAAHAVLARARLHLREELDMPDVTTTLAPDQPVISVLRRMRPEEMDRVIPEELVRLRRAAADAGRRGTGDPFGIFHAPITDESDGPLEIVLPIDDLADVDGDLRGYRLPGGMLASRLAVGPETDFPEILALYDEVHSWVTSTGRTPVGPPREIWHNSPAGPEPLRLTIAWPYAA